MYSLTFCFCVFLSVTVECDHFIHCTRIMMSIRIPIYRLSFNESQCWNFKWNPHTISRGLWVYAAFCCPVISRLTFFFTAAHRFAQKQFSFMDGEEKVLTPYSLPLHFWSCILCSCLKKTHSNVLRRWWIPQSRSPQPHAAVCVQTRLYMHPPSLIQPCRLPFCGHVRTYVITGIWGKSWRDQRGWRQAAVV